MHTRPDGQVVVDAFPATGYDHRLLNGYTAQVWIESGMSADETRVEAASLYRSGNPGRPEICLVLGAGNVGTITALDLIDQLYVRGNVCAVKMNPVNEYLGPLYEHIFSDFISRGWVRFLYGGADVGGYLAHHPGVEAIHMTGSAATYDVILWGTDDEAASRKANNTPLLDKPVTAELGGIIPFIVVPGDWSGADLRYQAEHIATTKLTNSGHNCNATQVLVVSQDWPLADKLIAEVRAVISNAEPRPSYYPRAQDRITNACHGMRGTEFLDGNQTRALVTDIDAHVCASILTDGVFASVLGVVRLPGSTAEQFLRNAVEFANDVLPGSLGAVVAIDPKTRKQRAQAFDDAIARLRYGAIGINMWTGTAFALATWGAYPGNTAQDIGSGIGIRNPVPPRAPLAVQRGTDPLTQAGFLITNKTAQTTIRRLVRFLVRRNPVGLPRIFASALRG